MFALIHFFSELRYKEVIDIHSGFRLGYVCDAEYDQKEGRLLSLITPGRAKLFGLLGRQPDRVLPWGSIHLIGAETVLVDCTPDRPPAKRPGFLEKIGLSPQK